MEAVVPPLGVCGCTVAHVARHALRYVWEPDFHRETGRASTAWYGRRARSMQWQKGIGLKFANEERRDGPREEAITLWGTEKCHFTG
jgi:hypothetical protein